ncbi:hypothetical protein DRJ00_06190, partial [Candidatus Aerophobetes bacterium]
SLLPPFQTSRIQMELLSPERLREMTFLRSKKGGLPGSEGESSSIYRHRETRRANLSMNPSLWNFISTFLFFVKNYRNSYVNPKLLTSL